MNLLTRAVPHNHYLSKLIKRFNLRYCRGVFRTFQQARAAIPSGKMIGYDNPDTSTLYVDRLDFVKPSDYAIFYWLGPLLTEFRSVFDFGGNVGWSYYAFQKYLRYFPELTWMICDLPAVVEAGRSLAVERNASHLTFTKELRHAERFDVLLTSGTLQYVEQELPDLLAPLSHKPRHLLINRVPLSDRPTYFTVQDIGPARCPYRISNQAEFLGSLQRLGYALIDAWRCPESSCRILFHPARNLHHYTGMYLRRATAQA
jgi:putative methyltransferase (TIGR04325 family)